MADQIITLVEPESGACAEILPSLGFNCFRWQATCAGAPRELIWSHPQFATGQERPSGSGIPLLFPFAGRIGGGHFRWRGREWKLEQNDRRGNAIHGFVYDRPWRVLEQSAQRVTGEFHAWRDAPELRSRWPADFRITATYELTGRSLAATYVLENPGDEELPYGFGTHAYFRIPLGGASANDCQIRVPAAEEWELVDLLPTGRRVPLDRPGTWREGLVLGDRVLDNVLTNLRIADGRLVTQLHDPTGRVTLTQEAVGPFSECVVYTPPHREAVCLEPYSLCPNAFSLAEQGIAAGVRTLAPGEKIECRIRLTIADDPPPDDDALWQRVHRAAC